MADRKASFEEALEAGKQAKHKHRLGRHFETDDIVASAIRSDYADKFGDRGCRDDQGCELVPTFDPSHIQKKVADKIVDHFKRELAAKRGGDFRRVDLACENLKDHCVTPIPQRDAQIDVQQAIDKIEKAAPDIAKVMRAAYLDELSRTECAKVVGVSKRSVERAVSEGRRRLRHLLADAAPEAPGEARNAE